MEESREGEGELQREIRGLNLKRTCHPEGKEGTRCHIGSTGMPNPNLVFSRIFLPGTSIASKHVRLFSLFLIFIKHLVYAQNCFKSLNIFVF